MKIKKCSICDFPKIWSKSMCKSCFMQKNPPKPIKKTSAINKISTKGKIKKEEKKKWLEELHNWELELWDSLEDNNGYIYCYETNKPMHRSVYRENLCVYSHCFPKSTYKKWAMKKWNILIVLPEIHDQWGSNMEKTPKMLAYFNKIKEKYGN